jgi:predicted regulator of Ras-like GTPase activity (Roadblock/LC7/MglB family)
VSRAGRAALDEVLAGLDAVPGVSGSLVCDARGRVLAEALPPGIDAAHAAQAAVLLADGADGLALTNGTADHVDFRFGEARLLVKAAAGALLLVLCGKGTNFQFLSIATSVAAGKLGALGGAPAALPARAAPEPAAAERAPDAPEARRRVPLPAKGLDELQRRLASASGRRTPEKA